jgi:4-oxalocrotonate tautomerase
MTYVYIQTLRPKTITQKRDLVREMTEAIARHFDSKPDEIRITLEEIERENFGEAGVLWIDKV